MNSSLKSHLCRAFVAVMLGASQAATARTPAASLADCDAPSHERVLIAAADPGNASAVWLDRRRLRWPGPAAGADSRYWLAHAVGGSLQARVGETVRGADGLIALALPSQALPPVLAQRFKHVAAGAELQLPEPAVRRLPALLQQHLLLVETDAPFLAPVPHRGKRNEPSFVAETARVLAQAKGVSFSEVAEKTTANVLRAFNKMPPVSA